MGLLGWAWRRKKADRQKQSESNDKAETVETIRKEAEENGATLANDGEGGLDPDIALEVFRRDEWTCQVPNCSTSKEDLDLDHISGHPLEIKDDPEATAWLKEQADKPKTDDPEGLHVLCLRHHDAVHSRERSLEQGNEPKPMPK